MTASGGFRASPKQSSKECVAMPMSREPQREYPITYIVLDRSNLEEMQRLQVQDRLLNTSMGGLLPEQSDPARFRHVLDVGCGTGGWLIGLAQTYPEMTRLIGVDASGKALDFAREQAAAAGVSDRVEFLLMDATQMLEFPNGFFDLVNQRLGMSYIRTWEWPKLLQEYRRVVEPYGVIRVTEADIPTSRSSPAMIQLSDLAVQAFSQAGYAFHPTRDGVTRELAGLLRQHNILEVQTRAYTFEYRAGTLEGQLFMEDAIHVFRTTKPFLQKWLRLPDDYEAIYQQMLNELNQPDFIGTMNLLTAWGIKI